MKVKKYINEVVNGFKIIDTYVIELPSGAKTRRVLLECQCCGQRFERCSSVDFEHIKCKCKCKYLKPRKQKYHFIEWNGKRYTYTDFCKLHNISPGTLRSRLKAGYTLDEAIEKGLTHTCVICDKVFKYPRVSKLTCSSTCARRLAHNKGKRKEYRSDICIMCGSPFSTLDDKQICCSERCRRQRDTVIRNTRLKHLKEAGQLDETVTLRNVYLRFKGICQGCGNTLSFESEVTSDEYPSVDHIIPLSKGGTHEWSNVQLLCRGCNIAKSDH